MKHVGKMKNNGAKVVVAYRTLPGDPYSALVVGTNALGESYHNSLMNLIEDVSAQQANELADILSVRKFPDGSNMLTWLHSRGQLKKVPTSSVLMTPNTQTSIPLDELNKLIAEQKGITLEELSITDGSKVSTEKSVATITEELVEKSPEVVTETLTVESAASQLNAKADLLLKEADALRKKADELLSSKKKKKVAA